MQKNIVIFDLDGTLSLVEHRTHLVRCEKPDWPAFFAACVDDDPNTPVIKTLDALFEQGREVWIVSGRSDEVRAETEAWLAEHRVPYDNLIMRRKGDHRPDHDLKKEWLDTVIPKEAVLCVFDDRTSVVDMWRAEGLTCFQVAPGDF
jgi:hypothetical protein